MNFQQQLRSLSSDNLKAIANIINNILLQRLYYSNTFNLAAKKAPTQQSIGLRANLETLNNKELKALFHTIASVLKSRQIKIELFA